MPSGARMILHNNDTLSSVKPAEKVKNLYLFSGQTAAKGYINSQVRVCAPEVHKFDAIENRWTNLQTKAPRKLTGRKHYAHSQCKDFIYISGGVCMGADKGLLHDFMSLNV